MIHTRWSPPNFRCRVSEEGDENGDRFWRLAHANDENAVKGLLADQALKIHSVESIDFTEWWRKRTSEEAASATAARKETLPWEFKPLWTELKGHLLDLFHHKCAYCEASFARVAFGDVEHYRPKAKVTEEPKHLGYYWLAYEPTNYLPVCQKCNQGRGKKNRFPIAGTRAYNPGDSLEDEEPLLLSPYYDDPQLHLQFCADGQVTGRTARGMTSIETYTLNRAALVGRRREAQLQIEMQFRHLVNTEAAGPYQELLEALSNGQLEFSAALHGVLEELFQKFGLP